MASAHTSLTAQATERNARLAALKSLKRKQQDADDSPSTETSAPDVTSLHLSGRNYDPATRGPKLGFDTAPTAGENTLELRAAELAKETAAQAAQAEAEASKPLDLWKLQPKKPNWDLKRDLEAKMKRVDVRTDNAVARLVRQRVLEQQKVAAAKTKGTDGLHGQGDAEGAGVDGVALVEGVHLRERAEKDEEMVDRDDEEV